MRHALTGLSLLTLLLTWRGVSPAQLGAPYLVRDLNTGLTQQWSWPSPGASAGNLALFTADDARHGRELWRSDGTTAGTQLVLDIEPGAESANIHQMIGVAERVFFTRSPIVAGRDSRALELWTSDGTAAGTAPVALLSTGDFGQSMVEVDGTVIIALSDRDAHTLELWRSDGTRAGTRRIRAPQPHIYAVDYQEIPLYGVGPWALFGDYSPSAGIEVSRSDGTAAGTYSLGNLTPGAESSILQGVAALDGGAAFLTYSQGGGGRSVHVSDGTARGTQSIARELGPPIAIAALDRRLYAFIDDDSGATLWRGAGMLASLEPVGPVPPPEDLIVWRGRLVFNERMTSSAGYRFWASDADGHVTLLNEAHGPTYFARFTPAPNLLYFIRATNGGMSAGWWRTDGTPEGTFEVDPEAGIPVGVVGDQLLYASAKIGTGIELFASDGTPGGTGILRNIADEAARNEESNPHRFTVFRDRLYFVTQPTYSGANALWVSDGTRAGTRLIHQFAPNVVVTTMTVADDRLYVIAGFRLYVMNGDELLAVDGFPNQVVRLQVADGSLYVFSDQLCRLAADLPPTCAPGVRNAGTIAVLEGRVYVVGDLGSDYGALLTTDFTAAGTRVVAATGGGNLTAFQGRLFFLRGHDTEHPALWTSDGTDAGTRQVREFDQRLFDYEPQLIPAGAHLFLSLGRCGGPAELWATNGTATGTVALAALATSCEDFAPRFAALDDRLYFAGVDRQHGVEPWRSDGTPRGTTLLRDLMPGAIGSHPTELRVAGERLTMSACDERGCEPFVSDGSSAGTVRVADLAAGAASSNPTETAVAANRLFLSADDGQHGAELWAVALDGVACAGDCGADGRVTVDELVTGVAIVLGDRLATECAQLDSDRDGTVAIDELIAAVRRALDGCVA
jgi:ELWxxDGT repeat protein